jgi:hypothetical protein
MPFWILGEKTSPFSSDRSLFPKYHWIRDVFHRLFVQAGFVYDGLFDWDETGQSISRTRARISYSAARCQFNHERQMREPKIGVKFPKPRAMFVSPWS